MSHEERLDAQNPGGAADAILDLLSGHVAHRQSEAHVLEHGLVRIERVVLEHHGDVAILGLDVVDHPAVDPGPAGGDCLRTGRHARDRGLAAARRSHQGDELPLLDREVEVVHRDDIAERLADVLEGDERCHVSALASRLASLHQVTGEHVEGNDEEDVRKHPHGQQTEHDGAGVARASMSVNFSRPGKSYGRAETRRLPVVQRFWERTLGSRCGFCSRRFNVHSSRIRSVHRARNNPA